MRFRKISGIAVKKKQKKKEKTIKQNKQTKKKTKKKSTKQKRNKKKKKRKKKKKPTTKQNGTVFHRRGRQPVQPPSAAGKRVCTACPAGGSVLGDRRFCPEAALYGKTASGIPQTAYERRNLSGFGGYGAVSRGSGKASVYLAGGDPEQTGGRPDFAAGGNPSGGRLFLHRF